MCHVSRVMCHMSYVTCHMSRVMCHRSLKKLNKKSDKVVELVGGGSVINGAYPVQFVHINTAKPSVEDQDGLLDFGLVCGGTIKFFFIIIYSNIPLEWQRSILPTSCLPLSKFLCVAIQSKDPQDVNGSIKETIKGIISFH